MSSETDHMDTCPLAPALGPLQERVTELETRVGNVETKLGEVSTTVEGVKTDTAAIRSAVVGVTRIGTFMKRHGRTVGGALFGIAVGSGFFSETTLQKFRIILNVLLGSHLHTG